MRGLGTPTGIQYPGYLRRMNEGTVVGPGGSGVAIWHFATNDLAATVEAANYFNAWAADLPKGSVIMAAIDIDGTPVLKQYIVTANTGTVVTVALQTTTAG